VEPSVAMAIRERLDGARAPIAFSSAACGADLLFLEAVLEAGGEANVVIPYEIPQFIEDSVQIASNGHWRERFERVLDQAAQVIIASERCRTAGPAVYTYGNLLLLGLATIRADQLDAELRGMAVWDGRPGDGPGGTAEVVEQWQHRGVLTQIVDLRELIDPRSVEPSARPPRAVSPVRSAAPFEMDTIKAMLFADAAGFSKLSDEQVPVFVHHFLGAVGALLARTADRPVMQNTWGDGLFFVFDTPSAAGRFALELCDAVTTHDWGALGLPPEMSLRIGLHAGPVYQYLDPVTHVVNFSGAHVSRAARIEPITPPGQVYASEAFAALCTAEGAAELACEYVGQTPLAKGYGIFRMYHVRRRPC
jgi:class 3 adenylate cyclase